MGGAISLGAIAVSVCLSVQQSMVAFGADLSSEQLRTLGWREQHWRTCRVVPNSNWTVLVVSHVLTW
jgi:hypothetical protein